MNNLVKWYRYLLVLPILIPLIVWLPIYLQIIDKRSNLVLLGMFFMGSLVLGGVPYLICAAFIFWSSRNGTENQVRKYYLMYPLGMIAIFLLVLLSDGLFIQKIDYLTISWLSFLPDFVNCFILLSSFTLLFGYGYVFLTFLIIRLIRGEAFDPKMP